MMTSMTTKGVTMVQVSSSRRKRRRSVKGNIEVSIGIRIIPRTILGVPRSVFDTSTSTWDRIQIKNRQLEHSIKPYEVIISNALSISPM